MTKRAMTAEDLYQFQLITDCQIAPDGKQIIFVVQRVDRESEKKYSNLWLVPTDGGRAEQFTSGDQLDHSPRWSPDGTSIAFLSNRHDEKQSQIYLIGRHGGEARPLTDMQGAFASFAWSPDGSQLVCQFRKTDAEVLERENDEQKKKLGIVYRRITRVFYKLDSQGYLPEENWHIWTINTETGDALQLSDGESNEEAPTWSPDGQSILFISNRHPEPDFNQEATELYLIPASGGEMRQLAAHEGQKVVARFSPNGRWIAYIGRRLKGNWWQNNSLYLIPAEGGEARNLTLEHDLHLANVTLSDMAQTPTVIPPIWSADSQQIYFNVSRRGDTPILAISLEGQLQPLMTDQGLTGAFTLDKTQEKLAYFHANQRDAGQIVVRDMQTGATEALTELNNTLLSQIDWGEIREVCFRRGEGHDLQGWILTPPNFDPTKKYPSILQIHGGPQAQYGQTLNHEFHYLASQGYVVYWCNPRGSQGYGEEFARAIYGRWGSVDFDDIMTWADYMAKEPYIDSERMGVTGGSYGGYMTTMIIGRSQRFKAAVAQRIVSNVISMSGSCDFNYAFGTLLGIPEAPWENLEQYWQLSPLKYIGNARTPTLIIHSEQDLRCNQEQAEQIFVALKRLGIDSELILFPDEPHGLSRIGRIDRRIARLTHIARWFNKYL